MHSAIATHGLTKQYDRKRAVDRLSLHVRLGEIYAFLGLNGAGKTTTIRMLLGMIRPTAGSVELLGTPVQPGGRGPWSQVGYLVETPDAYPELTVRENLEVVRRLRRVADRHAVDRTLERLALRPYAGQRAGTLSLGNRQRLGLAKALLHDPALFLLDEPANGLDPAGVVEVRALLQELTRQGVTVFMSSHILSEVARLATRIGIIHQGRLVEEIDASELDRCRHRWLVVDARDRRGARETLIRAGFSTTEETDGGLRLCDARAVTRPEEVASLLVAAGAPPVRLSVEEEDLETYFLRLVGVVGGDER